MFSHAPRALFLAKLFVLVADRYGGSVCTILAEALGYHVREFDQLDYIAHASFAG